MTQLQLCTPPTALDRWKSRWEVPSTTTEGVVYTVALGFDGTWGCSCPQWIYHRKQCKHICAHLSIDG